MIAGERFEEAESPVLDFRYDTDYTGYGLSEGLPRGLQVYWEGRNLTQEGMGVGTAALRQGGRTFFSRQFRMAEEGMGYTCFLDTELMIGSESFHSPWLSELWQRGVTVYRRFPGAQRGFLWLGNWVRRCFGIHNRFESAATKGNASFRYTRSGSELSVDCTIRVTEGDGTVCIMNEIGAERFTVGWKNNREISGPPGWALLDRALPLPGLYSESEGLVFSIRDIQVSPEVPWRVYWGREMQSDLCWAGYTIEIDLEDGGPSFLQCRYAVHLTRHTGEGTTDAETCRSDLSLF